MNQRKKFCECCKIMIPFTREAIRDHEATPKHKKAYDKALMDQHIKARKAHGNYNNPNKDRRQKSRSRSASP